MIYLRLTGGLGNQLFQVSAASIVSEFYRRDVFICDQSLSRYQVPRQPSYRQILDLTPNLILDKRKANPFLLYMSLNYRLGKLPVIGINHLPLKKNIVSGWPRLFMDNYYQSCWSSESIIIAIDKVRQMYIKVSPPTQKDRDVAIHIRGSDFLLNPELSFIGSHYYQRCISLALRDGLNRFSVVTDDVLYASNILHKVSDQYPAATFSLYKSNSEIEDFFHLCSSPSRIIGNSTFAWWAGALASSGKTWSPGKFLKSKSRNFTFPEEVVVSSF